MRTLHLALITLFVFVFFSPCQAAGNLYIFGVDESGSYSMRPQVMKMVERLIRSLESGDILYVRRITDTSYIDGEQTQLLPVPLKIPVVPPAFNQPAPGNRYNMVAQKQYLQAKAQSARIAQETAARTEALKEGAIRHILGITPLKSPKSDIYGFFAACADRLDMRGQQGRKIILIASDMQDNCKRQINLDLSGAEVVILAFEKDLDPKKTKRIRDEWTATLSAMQAVRVTFLNADEDMLAFIKQP